MEDDAKERLQLLTDQINQRYREALDALAEVQRTVDAFRSARVVRTCTAEDGRADLEWDMGRLKSLGLISEDEYEDATALRRRIYRRALGLSEGE